MNSHYRKLIANEFRDCVNNTIQRISNKDSDYRPFHSALLSDDVIFWSAFERSFSTSFGQRVIEEVARLVALSNGADSAEKQHYTYIDIDVAYENAIAQHLLMLRQGNRTDPWNNVIRSIIAIQPSGRTKNIRVISDLWWHKNGVDNYISLKTVKPNIDQTMVAKEDCLRLTVNDPNCKAYFGLPYNPYGEETTSYAHNPPMKVFDFINDPCVLIGRDMWDTIGGNGCYDELIEIASTVGQETRNKISGLR